VCIRKTDARPRKRFLLVKGENYVREWGMVDYVQFVEKRTEFEGQLKEEIRGTKSMIEVNIESHPMKK